MDQESILRTLKEDGIVLLGNIVPADSLKKMQAVYSRALEYPSWNTWIGYEQNEKWRRIVENLLVYDKAFMDLALQSDITDVLRHYIGPEFSLTEARGWETLATRRDFHGWHSDAWCDPDIKPAPREVKLACYLTDVKSGYFQYIKGTHGKAEPARHWPDREVEPFKDLIVDAKGEAGTCFLFDTSGIHRQSIPVLKRRWVIMYNYHDPGTPLGSFATGYGRYRPHLLNASFLGDLTPEEERILGFGRPGKNPEYHPAERRYPHTHSFIKSCMRLRLEYQEWNKQFNRVRNALKRKLFSS